MEAKLCASIAAVALLSACLEIEPVDLDNRPCERDGACASGYACDTAKWTCVKSEQLCIDADGDAHGVGAACVKPDCDDAVASCNVDCATDNDRDGQRDCDDGCLDVDGDGYGVGAACSGADCDDQVAACNASCDDVDSDGLRDCDVDTCVDVDADGAGRAAYPRSGCLTDRADADDANARLCVDTDADGCDDCAGAHFAPRADGQDLDSDGWCAVSDCNDHSAAVYPGHAEICDGQDNDCDGSSDEGLPTYVYYRDADGDTYGDPDAPSTMCASTAPSGYVVSAGDCDDTIPNCTTDCETNSDSDTPAVVDCVEEYCGSNPNDLAWSCIRISTPGEWATAVELVNKPGNKTFNLLLGDLTTDHKLEAITSSNVSANVRQEAGKVVTATFAEPDGPLFLFQGKSSEFGPLHVVANDKVQVAVQVDSGSNKLSELTIEGSPEVGLLIGGGSNTVSESTVTGSQTGVSISGGSNTVSGTTVTGEAVGIAMLGTGNTVSGTTVTGSQTGVSITGGSNTVSGTTVTGFGEVGISVVGAPAGLANIAGCLVSNGGTDAGLALGRAGIVLSGVTNVHLVHNVLVRNQTAALQLRRAGEVFIDHNTVANNVGDGVEIYGQQSTWLCMRNNLLVDNGGSAIHISSDVEPSWELDPICTGALGTSYGNSAAGNAGGACALDSGICSLPSSPAFWGASVAFPFMSTTFDDPAYYCPAPGTPSALDAGADLTPPNPIDPLRPLYDLNGAADGYFTSTAPDVGGREGGAEGCP